MSNESNDGNLLSLTDKEVQILTALVSPIATPELAAKVQALKPKPPTIQEYVKDRLMKWMDAQAEQEVTKTGGIVDALREARGNDVKIFSVSTNYSWERIIEVIGEAMYRWHALYDPMVHMADVEWLRERLRAEEMKCETEQVMEMLTPKKKAQWNGRAEAYGYAADLVDELQKKVLQR